MSVLSCTVIIPSPRNSEGDEGEARKKYSGEGEERGQGSRGGRGKESVKKDGVEGDGREEVDVVEGGVEEGVREVHRTMVLKEKVEKKQT